MEIILVRGILNTFSNIFFNVIVCSDVLMDLFETWYPKFGMYWRNRRQCHCFVAMMLKPQNAIMISLGLDRYCDATYFMNGSWIFIGKLESPKSNSCNDLRPWNIYKTVKGIYWQLRARLQYFRCVSCLVLSHWYELATFTSLILCWTLICCQHKIKHHQHIYAIHSSSLLCRNIC